jgi:uncharacterized membrane protein
MDSYSGDPVARRFDRLMALGAYGLLGVSVFTLWVPAIIAAVIAYTHRREADPLVASHFRFQITTFWIGFVLVLAAVIAFLTAGGFVFGALWSLLAAGSTDWGWDLQNALAGGGLSSGAAAGTLTLVGLLLWAISAVWTLIAAAWGALRLVSDRPMGQSRRVVRDLEIL